MRLGFPASAAAASTVGADAYTLKLAVRRFLARCKAEHVPPAEILVRFDTFLAEYNARQKRWLLSSNQADASSDVVSAPASSDDVDPGASVWIAQELGMRAFRR